MPQKKTATKSSKKTKSKVPQIDWKAVLEQL